jgi:hypothetical protein
MNRIDLGGFSINYIIFLNAQIFKSIFLKDFFFFLWKKMKNVLEYYEIF